MAPSSHPPRPGRLRPLRRPDGSVQLGTGPRSVRLVGLSDAEVRWLAALDPTRPVTEALAAAALEGIEPVLSGDSDGADKDGSTIALARYLRS